MEAIETKHFDAIVIGSGASGSIACKELTERGLEVLLLEAGRDINEEDFAPPPEGEVRPRGVGVNVLPRVRAALHGQPLQARRAMYDARSDRLLVNDLQNPYTTPRDAYFLWIRSRMLGGRLHVYGRMLLRMSDYDFKSATRDGFGLDWPISYADIAPYYDRIEDFIGLYGQSDGIPHLPDGRYIGTATFTKAEREFKARVEARWPERRVIAWRYAAPNTERVPLGIIAARQTGRLTTRTDAVVSEITVNDRNGLATGAVFIDRTTKREHRVTADVVVLCASAIESVRLLLNSRSSRHPNGLANSSGLLGQYFMDQVPTFTFGAIPTIYGFEHDESDAYDPVYPTSGGIYIPRSGKPAGDAGFGPTRGIAFQGGMGRFPVPSDREAPFVLVGYAEMLPRRENSVTLDPRRKDAWGVPAPRITCRPGDSERVAMREQVRVAKEIVEECGYRLDFTGSPLGLDSKKVLPHDDPLTRMIFRAAFKKTVAMGAAIHECGGARMGDDPATSVLNRCNQAWDAPNLFVTDASCFVSNGIAGPTLTIMALTARACDYIAREHAHGSIAGSEQ